MAKPRFPKIDVVYSNPPDKSVVCIVTISRRVGNPPHKYERDVKPNDLLSSPEAATILGLSVRHLYRLVDAGRLKYKKKKNRLLFGSRDVQRFRFALALSKRGIKGRVRIS